jgi:hypothetical protein
MKFGREVKIHVRKIIPKFDDQTINRTPGIADLVQEHGFSPKNKTSPDL